MPNHTESSDSAKKDEITFDYTSIPHEDSNASSCVAKWGIGIAQPLLITCGITAAGLIAVLHHLFDAHLEGRPVDGFWDQTMSRRAENAFATVFQILFASSAGISLCQVSWYTARRTSLRVRDLDALISPPSIATILHPNLVLYAPLGFIITLLIFASPVVPVFAPSLTQRQGEPYIRNITVPTIDLALANAGVTWSSGSADPAGMDLDVGWERAIVQALAASTSITWPIPPDCSPECNYTITYLGPAVKCVPLLSEQISNGTDETNGSEPEAYLNRSNLAIMNFTSGIGDNDTFYHWTVATFLSEDTSNSDYQGSACTAYRAAYTATVHYVNGTQTNSASVDYLSPLNKTFHVPLDGPGSGWPTTPDPYMITIMDTLSSYLEGVVYSYKNYSSAGLSSPDKAGLLATQNAVIQKQKYGLGITLGTGITNMSQGLTDLVTNVTLNFMNTQNLSTDNSSAVVLATLPFPENIYVYPRFHLIITYGLAFVLLAASGVAGLLCLVANGVPSSNQFSQILATTRNPRLDELARGACLGNGPIAKTGLDGVRLRFGEVDRESQDGERHAAFGVVDRDTISPLKRGCDYS